MKENFKVFVIYFDLTRKKEEVKYGHFEVEKNKRMGFQTNMKSVVRVLNQRPEGVYLKDVKLLSHV